MLYDKSHFKKVNDKKVLHKVKKHWVTLSLATLMLLGGTSLIADATAHASQTGNNRSDNINPSLNNNQGDNHSLQLVNNGHNDQTDQSVNREKASINAQQPQGINALNQAQTKFKVDFSTANLLNDNRAYMNDQGRTNQIAQPSVNQRQVKSATSEAEYHDQIIAEAQEHWNILGDGLNSHPRRLLGKAPETKADEQNKIAAITDSLAAMNPMFNDFNTEANLNNYQSEMTSYSNVAHAELERYTNVENLSDDSGKAKNVDNQLNSDISAMPTRLMAFNSLNASTASTEVSTLDAAKPEDYTKIDDLYDKIVGTNGTNGLYNETSQEDADAGKLINDAKSQESNVITIFASVSAAANSAGEALANNTDVTYPVANITTGNEMRNAAFDDNIHHVNIMNNFDMWHCIGTPGTGNGAYAWWYVPIRNLTYNGLNDDGTWNTVDFGGLNINYHDNFDPNDKRYTVPGSGGKTAMDKLIIKNMHLYGGSYWGPFSVNENDHFPALNIYDNVTYDGSELSFNEASNTNVVFAGKVIINTGAYSPSGKDVSKYSKYGTGYDYDTGGLNAHPFDGDTGPDLEDPEMNAGAGFTGPAIDHSSNQEDMQVPGDQDNYIEFDKNSDFTGYTSNGENITLNGSGSIILGDNAHVHLIPRGNEGEDANLGAGMVNAIDIDGNGQLDVGHGAVLEITPTDETDSYNTCGDLNKNYYPGAIHIAGSGNSAIHIYPGGVINIRYPKVGTRSLSDDTLYNASNGVNPDGLITIKGDAKIIAERDSKLVVDGGTPINKANDGTSGSLVAFTDGGNAGSAVEAMPGSNIELMTGGTQPIILFRAPSGTKIIVNDPKLFTLNFNNNSNSKSQLASQGTGIEGLHVNVNDENNNSFGQYGEVVFPGRVFTPDTTLVTDIVDNALNPLHQWLITHFGNGDPNNSNVTNVWSDVNNTISTIVSGIKNDPNNPGIAPIYPYAEYPLDTKKDKNLCDEFNHSIDISKVILEKVASNINSQAPTNYGPRITSKDIGWMLSQISDDSSNDEPMTYDGQTVPIHGNGKGFNLQHGFAFTGVPDTYVEGIKVDGNTISGYSYPGSYIRINALDNELTGFQTDTDGHKITVTYGTPIITDSEHMYDDYMSYNGKEPYDSADQYPDHSNYLAIASLSTGYWKIQLPTNWKSQLPAKDKNKITSIEDLRVTAHTQTVSPADAGRIIGSYTNGENSVDIGRNKDTPDTADAYDDYAETKTDKNGNVIIIKKNANLPSETYDDDQISGMNNPITNTQIVKNGSDQTDDNNAGRDFEAGYIKGEHDRNYMVNDNSIYQYAGPFIKGYEIARGTARAIDNTGLATLTNELRIVRGAVNNYNSYLKAIKADSSAAGLDDAAINNTVTALSQAPIDLYQNLNHTRTSVATASNVAKTSNADVYTQYSTVSGIDNSAISASESFTSASNDYASESNSYILYYTQANKAYNDGDSADKQAYLTKASNAQNLMNDDLSIAETLANSIGDSETSASNDNQSASSDSNSISQSTLSVETSASNDIASALSLSASSYSTATETESTDASIVAFSVSSKASYLLSEGSVIASEYTVISSIITKYPSLADILTNYQVGTDSSLAHDNSDVAYSASNSAQTFDQQLPVLDKSASNLANDVNKYTVNESLVNSQSNFSSASTDNSKAVAELANSVNSSANTAANTIWTQWTFISGLDDKNFSVSMSDALSAAENRSQSLVTVIDIDSGIASAESSATNYMMGGSIISDGQPVSNSMQSASIVISDAGDTERIANDQSIITSAISAINNDYEHGNISDANNQASSAEVANSDAQSIANDDMGTAATRVIPITFMVSLGSSQYSQVGCSNEALSGHVGEPAISPLSSVVPAPSGYSYAGSQPAPYNGVDFVKGDSYAFIKDNIDIKHAGYMKPVDVLVNGNLEKIQVNFIDEDGDVVASSSTSGIMGGLAKIPTDAIPKDDNGISEYTVDSGQPSSCAITTDNLTPTGMKPYNVYVYANRTFQFNVMAHKYIAGNDTGFINTTPIDITGKDGDVKLIKPTDYVPTGFVSDPNNNDVYVEITKSGLKQVNVKLNNGKVTKVLNVINDHTGKPLPPDVNWKYNATPTATKPIYVEFIDQDNGNPVGSAYTVNGLMDQWVNVVDNSKGKSQLPDSYQVVNGTPVMYQITDNSESSESNPIRIPVIYNNSESAVVDYVDKDTDDSVIQRTITAPVGTRLGDLTDEYINDLPYSYDYDGNAIGTGKSAKGYTWDNNNTVVKNGQYIVYVTRQNDRPMPTPSDDKPDGYGRINVNYVDPTKPADQNILSSYSLIKPDKLSFNANDFITPKGTSHYNFDYPFDDYLPSNFTSPSIVGQKPTTFNENQDQTLTISVKPSGQSSKATANVEYYDIANRTYVNDNESGKRLSIPITGNVGNDIDYSSYQQFVPQGYRYAGMGSHDNVIEPDDVDVIMVAPVAPAEQFGQINVNYVIKNSDGSTMPYDTLQLNGIVGKPFNIGYYEDLWGYDSSNSYAFDGTNGSVPSQFMDTPQNVTIYLKSYVSPKQYSNINIHFINANAATGDNEHTSEAKLEAQSKHEHYTMETMSGHIGDLFDLQDYEDNTPVNTTFAGVITGQDNIMTFNGNDQNVWIKVNPINISQDKGSQQSSKSRDSNHSSKSSKHK